MYAPAQSRAPVPSVDRNFHAGMRERPAMGGAMVPSPGTNFAITSAHPPSFLNQARVLLTQESGSREMRHSNVKTELPFCLPRTYQAESATKAARNAIPRAGPSEVCPSPISAPMASRIGTEGTGAPNCSASTQANNTQYP